MNKYLSTIELVLKWVNLQHIARKSQGKLGSISVKFKPSQWVGAKEEHQLISNKNPPELHPPKEEPKVSERINETPSKEDLSVQLCNKNKHHKIQLKLENPLGKRNMLFVQIQIKKQSSRIGLRRRQAR